MLDVGHGNMASVTSTCDQHPNLESVEQPTMSAEQQMPAGHLSFRICATSTAGAPAASLCGFECLAAAMAACGVADAICPPPLPRLLLPVGPRFTASLATQTVCAQQHCTFVDQTCQSAGSSGALAPVFVLPTITAIRVLSKQLLSPDCVAHIEGGDAGADQRPGGDAGLGDARRCKHRHQHH